MPLFKKKGGSTPIDSSRSKKTNSSPGTPVGSAELGLCTRCGKKDAAAAVSLPSQGKLIPLCPKCTVSVWFPSKKLVSVEVLEAAKEVLRREEERTSGPSGSPSVDGASGASSRPGSAVRHPSSRAVERRASRAQLTASVEATGGGVASIVIPAAAGKVKKVAFNGETTVGLVVNSLAKWLAGKGLAQEWQSFVLVVKGNPGKRADVTLRDDDMLVHAMKDGVVLQLEERLDDGETSTAGSRVATAPAVEAAAARAAAAAAAINAGAPLASGGSDKIEAVEELSDEDGDEEDDSIDEIVVDDEGRVNRSARRQIQSIRLDAPLPAVPVEDGEASVDSLPDTSRYDFGDDDADDDDSAQVALSSSSPTAKEVEPPAPVANGVYSEPPTDGHREPAAESSADEVIVSPSDDDNDDDDDSGEKASASPAATAAVVTQDTSAGNDDDDDDEKESRILTIHVHESLKDEVSNAGPVSVRVRRGAPYDEMFEHVVALLGHDLEASCGCAVYVMDKAESSMLGSMGDSELDPFETDQQLVEEDVQCFYQYAPTSVMEEDDDDVEISDSEDDAAPAGHDNGHDSSDDDDDDDDEIVIGASDESDDAVPLPSPPPATSTAESEAEDEDTVVVVPADSDEEDTAVVVPADSDEDTAVVVAEGDSDDGRNGGELVVGGSESDEDDDDDDTAGPSIMARLSAARASGLNESDEELLNQLSSDDESDDDDYSLDPDQYDLSDSDD